MTKLPPRAIEKRPVVNHRGKTLVTHAPLDLESGLRGANGRRLHHDESIRKRRKRKKNKG
jgi:hypothetical protein